MAGIEREPRLCPFCGGVADVHLQGAPASFVGSPLVAFVQCRECGSRGELVPSGGGESRTATAKRRAVRVWNRRHEEVRRDVPTGFDSWETVDMDLRDFARGLDEEHPGEGIAEYVADVLDRVHALAGV